MRKLKYQNKIYYLKVGTYSNHRMRLYLSRINKPEIIELTINTDIKVYEGNILLDPAIFNLGIDKILKKAKIIRNLIISIGDIPMASLNTGILRKYDARGLKIHLEMVGDETWKNYLRN